MVWSSHHCYPIFGLSVVHLFVPMVWAHTNGRYHAGVCPHSVSQHPVYLRIGNSVLPLCAAYRRKTPVQYAECFHHQQRHCVLRYAVAVYRTIGPLYFFRKQARVLPLDGVHPVLIHSLPFLLQDCGTRSGPASMPL